MMKTIYIFSALLVCTSYAQNVQWRKIDSTTYYLQVQEHPKESPVLELYNAREAERSLVLEITEGWEKMSVDGFWEIKKWSPELPDGLYEFSFKDSDQLALTNLLLAPERFKSITGKFDHLKKEITWEQSISGPARTMAQFSSGMMVAEPAGWSLWTDGTHSVKWDFIGKDGIDYENQPSIVPVIQFAPFHPHILVVGQPEFETDFLDLLKLPHESLECDLILLDQKGARLQSPEPGCLLRMSLTPDSRKLLQGRRFEFLVYLGGEFLHEEAQGVSPSTYILPSTIPKNTTSLTVNIFDYEGNWGVSTITFE